MQSGFAVTNIVACEKHADMAVLCVLCDTKLVEEAVNVAPTLEDYYQYVFGNREE